MPGIEIPIPSQPARYNLVGPIDEKTGYRSAKMDIPFYNLSDDSVKIKITYDKIQDAAALSTNAAAISQILTDRFILHYYPEYYIYLRDATLVETTDQFNFYQTVRTMVQNALSIGYYDPTDPQLQSENKSIIIGNISVLELSLTNEQIQILKVGVDPTDKIYDKVHLLPLDSPTGLEISVIDPSEIREILEILGLLPPFGESLVQFNHDEGIDTLGKTLQLSLETYSEESIRFDEILNRFAQQSGKLAAGIMPVDVDFESVRSTIPQILNGVILASILEEITGAKFAAGNPPMDDIDLSAFAPEGYSGSRIFGNFSITFGTRTPPGYDPANTAPGSPREAPAVGIIEYSVGHPSTGVEEFVLKIGYLSNSKYNNAFRDGNTLAILKSRESILRADERAEEEAETASKQADFFGSLSDFALGNTATPDWANQTTFSFTDFYRDSNPADFGVTNMDNWVIPDLPSAADLNINNEYIKAAAEMGLIDLSETKKIEKGFVASLSPAQLKELREKVRENPEVYKKVAMANKKKALKTSADVVKTINSFLNGSMPGVKKGSKLDMLLRSIGIDQLVKEALLCRTFGLPTAISRVVGAAANAINTVGMQLYMEPSDNGVGLTVPSLGSIQKQLKGIYTIDGELWKKMLKAMIDSLQKAVLEIVKGLAKLISELCKLSNPRAEDYGATDMADLVDHSPGIVGPGPLTQIAAKRGLSDEQMQQYLSAVSSILSSMEICFLFTSRSEVTYETLEKILRFNLAYEDIQVRNTLNSHGAILGFFADISRFTDITEFCNQIANELYNLNYDNICLIEEAAPDAINQILQDMIENGINLTNPLAEINLDCPKRPDYIRNPLVSDTIPSLLNNIVEVVEMEFVNSISSLTSILKEPTFASTPGTISVNQNVEAAGGAQLTTETDTDAKDVLKKVADVFETISDHLADLESCNLDLADILGTEADTAVEVFDTVMKILVEMVNDPEFINGITDMSEILSNASEDESGSSPAVTYQFPRKFAHKWNNYLPNTAVFTSAHTNKVSAGPRFSSNGTNTPLYGYENMQLTFMLGSTNQSSGAPRGKIWDFYQPGDSEYTEPVGSPSPYQWDADNQSAYAVLWDADRAGTIDQTGRDDLRALTISQQRYFQQSGSNAYLRPMTTAEADTISISYPSYSTGQTSNFVDITLNSTLISSNYVDADFDIGGSSLPSSGYTNTSDVNPYVSIFSDPLISQVEFEDISLNDTRRNQYTREAESVLFPGAFTGLVENTFDYIQREGIFTTDKLDKVNFFHDNANCLPEDVADFLDADGILAILQDEMLDALCFDESTPGEINPMGAKIRDVIRYGVFMLLIQIHIAQFVIKNIFVLSAFNIKSFMESEAVQGLLASTIRNQMTALLDREPLVSETILKYMNKKITRTAKTGTGGLKDALGDIVFASDVSFTSENMPDIIDYMVMLRVAQSRTAVANALAKTTPGSTSKSTDRIFIEDILTVQPSWLGGAKLRGRIYLDVNSETATPSYRLLGGAPGSVRHHRDELRRELSEYINNNMNLGYGKLALERVAVWDDVRPMSTMATGLSKPEVAALILANTPPVLTDTSGSAYGMETSIFKDVLVPGSWINRGLIPGRELDSSGPLRFDNLRIKYRIVYYLPYESPVAAAHSLSPDGTTDTGDDDSGLFYDAHRAAAALKEKNRFHLGTQEGTLHRYVLKELDAETTIGTISTGDTLFTQQLETYTSSSITDTEFAAISADPTYQDFFQKAFNSELITFIPILYNFYLTDSQFPQADGRFLAPKLRCIDIFKDTIANQNNHTPSPRQRALPPPGPDTPQFDNLSLSARDFILRMLIETPIEILRSLAELVDPHIAISKLIKTITGTAFYAMGEAIEKSPVLTPLKGPLPNPAPNAPEGSTVPGIAPGITGEGAMKLLLCGLQKGLDEAVANAPRPPGMDDVQLTPRISYQGVDFKGTVPGIFMLPITPLGLLYLLLMLLKRELPDELGDDIIDVSEETPPSEC